MKKQPKLEIESPFPKILPEIRSLIEVSRHHAAVTANLALVNLYWNIGRIITEDIQKNEKRAGYGEQLVEEIARELTKDYGSGYSAKNLWDMKRFFSAFKILQALPGEFKDGGIRQTLVSKSVGSKAVQPPSDESPAQQICQTVSDKFRSHPTQYATFFRGMRRSAIIEKGEARQWKYPDMPETI